MASRSSTADFVEKAKLVHGEMYSYEMVEYTRSCRNVKIVCHKHGVFDQLPNNHLRGSGCLKCGKAVVGDKLRLSGDDFMQKAIAVHGDRYDYSKVFYRRYTTYVIIGCAVHGDFKQTPLNHLAGKGCNGCKGAAISESRKGTFEEFKTGAINRHGDRYDYSAVEYVNSFHRVKIVCKAHGEFLQLPAAHVYGAGCAACAGVVAHTSGAEGTFAIAAMAVHGNLYDYSEVDYVHTDAPVKVFCKVHQSHFLQRATNHLSGQGCPECSVFGYRTNKAGNFYILKSGRITKIGITNRDGRDRAKKISKSSGQEFHVATQIRFADGWVARFAETTLLTELRHSHERVIDTFDGATECFYDVNFDALLSRLVIKVSEAFTLRQ